MHFSTNEKKLVAMGPASVAPTALILSPLRRATQTGLLAFNLYDGGGANTLWNGGATARTRVDLDEGALTKNEAGEYVNV